jgi:competence protein ComEA
MFLLRLWIRKIFGFSRTETNAFLILLPLMAVMLLSEPLYSWWKIRHPPDFSHDAKVLDSMMAQLRWDKPDSMGIPGNDPVEWKCEVFNPNQLARDKFIQMGLSPLLAKRIVRYREKGGVFRKKEDLLKIYGMDSTWFAIALPWILIPEKNELKLTFRSGKQPTPKEKADINIADSLQLVKIYGIGPALSKRIRAYRDKLGGFVSMDQLKEVYGLDTAVVNRIKNKFRVDENFQPQRIPLNTATLDILIQHPYFRRKEASVIIAFRLQHGKFLSVDQLREIQPLTPEWIEKVRPYLTLEE